MMDVKITEEGLGLLSAYGMTDGGGVQSGLRDHIRETLLAVSRRIPWDECAQLTLCRTRKSSACFISLILISASPHHLHPMLLNLRQPFNYL